MSSNQNIRNNSSTSTRSSKYRQNNNNNNNNNDSVDQSSITESPPRTPSSSTSTSASCRRISIKLLLVFVIFSFGILSAVIIAVILYTSGLDTVRNSAVAVSVEQISLATAALEVKFNKTYFAVESVSNATRTRFPDLFASNRTLDEAFNVMTKISSIQVEEWRDTQSSSDCRWKNRDVLFYRYLTRFAAIRAARSNVATYNGAATPPRDTLIDIQDFQYNPSDTSMSALPASTPFPPVVSPPLTFVNSVLWNGTIERRSDPVAPYLGIAPPGSILSIVTGRTSIMIFPMVSMQFSNLPAQPRSHATAESMCFFYLVPSSISQEVLQSFLTFGEDSQGFLVDWRNGYVVAHSGAGDVYVEKNDTEVTGGERSRCFLSGGRAGCFKDINTDPSTALLREAFRAGLTLDLPLLPRQVERRQLDDYTALVSRMSLSFDRLFFKIYFFVPRGYFTADLKLALEIALAVSFVIAVAVSVFGGYVVLHFVILPDIEKLAETMAEDPWEATKVAIVQKGTRKITQTAPSSLVVASTTPRKTPDSNKKDNYDNNDGDDEDSDKSSNINIMTNCLGKCSMMTEEVHLLKEQFLQFRKAIEKTRGFVAASGSMASARSAKMLAKAIYKQENGETMMMNEDDEEEEQIMDNDDDHHHQRPERNYFNYSPSVHAKAGIIKKNASNKNNTTTTTTTTTPGETSDNHRRADDNNNNHNNEDTENKNNSTHNNSTNNDDDNNANSQSVNTNNNSAYIENNNNPNINQDHDDREEAAPMQRRNHSSASTMTGYTTHSVLSLAEEDGDGGGGGGGGAISHQRRKKKSVKFQSSSSGQGADDNNNNTNTSGGADQTQQQRNDNNQHNNGDNDDDNDGGRSGAISSFNKRLRKMKQQREREAQDAEDEYQQGEDDQDNSSPSAAHTSSSHANTSQMTIEISSPHLTRKRKNQQKEEDHLHRQKQIKNRRRILSRRLISHAPANFFLVVMIKFMILSKVNPGDFVVRHSYQQQQQQQHHLLRNGSKSTNNNYNNQRASPSSLSSSNKVRLHDMHNYFALLDKKKDAHFNSNSNSTSNSRNNNNNDNNNDINKELRRHRDAVEQDMLLVSRIISIAATVIVEASGLSMIQFLGDSMLCCFRIKNVYKQSRIAIKLIRSLCSLQEKLAEGQYRQRFDASTDDDEAAMMAANNSGSTNITHHERSGGTTTTSDEQQNNHNNKKISKNNNNNNSIDDPPSFATMTTIKSSLKANNSNIDADLSDVKEHFNSEEIQEIKVKSFLGSHLLTTTNNTFLSNTTTNSTSTSRAASSTSHHSEGYITSAQNNRIFVDDDNNNINKEEESDIVNNRKGSRHDKNNSGSANRGSMMMTAAHKKYNNNNKTHSTHRHIDYRDNFIIKICAGMSISQVVVLSGSSSGSSPTNSKKTGGYDSNDIDESNSLSSNKYDGIDSMISSSHRNNNNDNHNTAHHHILPTRDFNFLGPAVANARTLCDSAPQLFLRDDSNRRRKRSKSKKEKTTTTPSTNKKDSGSDNNVIIDEVSHYNRSNGSINHQNNDDDDNDDFAGPEIGRSNNENNNSNSDDTSSSTSSSGCSSSSSTMMYNISAGDLSNRGSLSNLNNNDDDDDIDNMLWGDGPVGGSDGSLGQITKIASTPTITQNQAIPTPNSSLPSSITSQTSPPSVLKATTNNYVTVNSKNNIVASMSDASNLQEVSLKINNTSINDDDKLGVKNGASSIRINKNANSLLLLNHFELNRSKRIHRHCMKLLELDRSQVAQPQYRDEDGLDPLVPLITFPVSHRSIILEARRGTDDYYHDYQDVNSKNDNNNNNNRNASSSSSYRKGQKGSTSDPSAMMMTSEDDSDNGNESFDDEQQQPVMVTTVKHLPVRPSEYDLRGSIGLSAPRFYEREANLSVMRRKAAVHRYKHEENKKKIAAEIMKNNKDSGVADNNNNKNNNNDDDADDGNKCHHRRVPSSSSCSRALLENYSKLQKAQVIRLVAPSKRRRLLPSSTFTITDSSGTAQEEEKG